MGTRLYLPSLLMLLELVSGGQVVSVNDKLAEHSSCKGDLEVLQVSLLLYHKFYPALEGRLREKQQRSVQQLDVP